MTKAKRRIFDRYVFLSHRLLLLFFRFKCVTTGLGRGFRLILVLTCVFEFTSKFFLEIRIRVRVNFHHNHISVTVVSFSPVPTVCNTALYLWHVISPPRGYPSQQALRLYLDSARKLTLSDLDLSFHPTRKRLISPCPPPKLL